MNRKQLEGAVVFMNMYTNPAISINVLIERYGMKLSDRISNEDALDEFLKSQEITFKQINASSIKTLEEFKTTGQWEDLNQYLGDKPCQIDLEMCEHIQCAYVASNYVGIMKEGLCIAQNGDADYSFDDGDNKRFTFMTMISYPDGSHWHLGILPDLNED
ncbi:hypothetical protein [Sphingobacterium mizutaii]|uniref:hypothetical protein n=1 Tax=Sphingobacterium mizutaii TaxID=1010 RepID=UPI003D96474B